MKRRQSLQTILVVCFILCLNVRLTSTACGQGAQADMVFIMDESGSVGSSNFHKMKEFVRDLVDAFDIGDTLIRVGVQKYSSGANTEFNLDDYYDKNAMKTRVMAISYRGGGTNTGGALKYCRENMFKASNGDRSGVPNIAIVLTDGRSWSYTDTANEARNLRATGATVFSVGIGSGIPLTELNEMATDPDSDHVFQVSSFSALNNIKQTFQTKACPPDPCKRSISLSGQYLYTEINYPPNIPVNTVDTVYFWVKTCNDAHMILSSHVSSWQQGTTMYEIVIGGWGNTQSVIRTVRQGHHWATKQHYQPTSCTQFKRYFVSWANGEIAVGNDVLNPSTGKYQAEAPFMKWKNPSPWVINHIFVSAWPGAPAEWQFGLY